MNILLQTREKETFEEIKEFTESDNSKVFHSDSADRSVALLSNFFFDVAVIKIKTLNDFTILKFINETYPHIKVVVLAEKKFRDLITLFSTANYSIVSEPFRLSELNTTITEKRHNSA
jgi:DNA-binding response OmpR family regulator